MSTSLTKIYNMDHISNIITILKKCNPLKLSKVVDEDNNYMTNGELLNILKLINFTDGDVETCEVYLKNFEFYCTQLRARDYLNYFE